MYLPKSLFIPTTIYFLLPRFQYGLHFGGLPDVLRPVPAMGREFRGELDHGTRVPDVKDRQPLVVHRQPRGQRIYVAQIGLRGSLRSQSQIQLGKRATSKRIKQSLDMFL